MSTHCARAAAAGHDDDDDDDADADAAVSDSPLRSDQPAEEKMLSGQCSSTHRETKRDGEAPTMCQVPVQRGGEARGALRAVSQAPPDGDRLRPPDTGLRLHFRYHVRAEEGGSLVRSKAPPVHVDVSLHCNKLL